MENIIELQLLAVDFKETEYSGIGHCAIEKAVNRQLGVNAAEVVHYTVMGDGEYFHQVYRNIDFETDKALASMLTDEEIVRVITLTKV